MCQIETTREVHCIVRNSRQATQIVELLEAARFDREEILIEAAPAAPQSEDHRIHVCVETDSMADVHRACEGFEEAGAENIVVLPRFAPAEESPAAGAV